jgi:two-component system response regulator
MGVFSILLVEDNDDDRFLTLRQLKKLPAVSEIEVAKNGDEASKRILGSEGANGLPSLVLLDLQLPKVDGITLLSNIRSRYDRQELPVIILSSSDNPRDLILCQELGINGYLAKPLDPSALLELLPTLTQP